MSATDVNYTPDNIASLFSENKAMIEDQANRGAAPVQQVATQVSGPQDIQPIDMGHVNSLDIGGLRHIEGIKVQQTPEVSDLNYACKSISNVTADAVQSVSNIFGAGEFTNDQPPEPELAMRAPQPQFMHKPTPFGFG